MFYTAQVAMLVNSLVYHIIGIFTLQLFYTSVICPRSQWMYDKGSRIRKFVYPQTMLMVELYCPWVSGS